MVTLTDITEIITKHFAHMTVILTTSIHTDVCTFAFPAGQLSIYSDRSHPSTPTPQSFVDCAHIKLFNQKIDQVLEK